MLENDTDEVAQEEGNTKPWVPFVLQNSWEMIVLITDIHGRLTKFWAKFCICSILFNPHSNLMK